jgi:hypothetical protein
LHRLGIMANANYSPAVLEMRKVQEAANKFNIEAVTFEIRQADDIAPVFEARKARSMPSMSRPTRSQAPTVFASIP